MRSEFLYLIKQAISRECGDCKDFKQAMLAFEWEISKPKRIDALEKPIVFASCYSDDKSLIYDAIILGLRFGPSYVLNKCSEQAAELMERYRAVLSDYHRLISYTRFQEHSDHLIAEVDTAFDLYNVLLQYFRERYKNHKIVLLSRKRAYIANGSIYSMPRDEFFSKYNITLNKRDPLWEIYYTSQYIRSRRNKRLAMRHMPKHAAPAMEKSFIDFGIQEKKISDYLA